MSCPICCRLHVEGQFVQHRRSPRGYGCQGDIEPLVHENGRKVGSLRGSLRVLKVAQSGKQHGSTDSSQMQKPVKQRREVVSAMPSSNNEQTVIYFFSLLRQQQSRGRPSSAKVLTRTGGPDNITVLPTLPPATPSRAAVNPDHEAQSDLLQKRVAMLTSYGGLASCPASQEREHG